MPELPAHDQPDDQDDQPEEWDLRPRRLRRRPADLFGLACGLAVLGSTAVLASDGLIPGEEIVFRAINDLPDWVYVPLWPFMQYGMFLTIPVLTLVAVLVRRYRLALTMALSGVGVYVLAKVVKEVVQRGRPAVFIDGVAAREVVAVNSLGYPSGHTSVAAALTIVATPYLRGRWKLVPSALLVIVFIGRMYVSAHVPLDLIGGIGLGAAAGSLVNLVLGVPEADAHVDHADVDRADAGTASSSQVRSTPSGAAPV